MKSSEAPVVLIVDDEPAIGWTLERALARHGWRAVVAGCAVDGLRLARMHKPSAVLLDIRLPDNDGLSVLSQFRQIIGSTPVIVITAFGDLPTALRAAHSGADDFLPKPFDLTRAMETIDRAVSRHRSLPTSVSPHEVPEAFSDPMIDFERAAEALAEDLLNRCRDSGDLLEQMRRPMERALFRIALKHAQGNRILAARWLGVHRATLRTRLRAQGLDEPNEIPPD